MPRYPRWFGVGLFVQAFGLAATAALGPLALGVIDYRYSRSLLNQAIGLDAFALLVVAPVAVLAGVLARRGHRVAPLIAMAPTGFALYMLVQYVIGPEYLTVEGNGERAFLFFVAQFVLSGALLLQAWSSAEPPACAAAARRRRGTTLVVIGAFVLVGMYLSNGFLAALWDFPAFVAERAAVSEYDEHPTAYWIVALLDLAVVVPLTVATGLALRRGAAWAGRAYYGVVGWFGLVPGSVAAMAIVMVLRDDPAASSGKAVFFTLVAIVLLVVAGRVFAPLFVVEGDEGDQRKASPSNSPSERQRSM